MESRNCWPFWLIWHILLGGFGFIIAPLVIFILKKDDPFVYEHAKQALVAHIMMLLTGIVVGFLCVLIIGLALIPVVIILALILLVTSLIAAYKAFEWGVISVPIHSRDY